MSHRIRIRAYKFLNEDKECEPSVKITEASAIWRPYLPSDYLCGGCPHCAGHRDGILLTKRSGWDIDICRGKVFTKKEFKEVINLLKECARRLHNIKASLTNKSERNKKKYKDWDGEIEIEI